MLKIYTELGFLEFGDYVEMLIPFVGLNEYDTNPNNIVSGRFDELFKNGKSYLQLVDKIEESDVIIFPIRFPIKKKNIDFEKAFSEFTDKIKFSNKKTIVFADYEISDILIPISNCIIFDGALYKSNQPVERFSWPYFFEDFIKKYKEDNLVLKNKSEIPIVGFSGYSPPLELKFGKQKVIAVLKLIANYLGVMKYLPNLSAHSYRSRAILGLKKSKRISCNFRIKENFAFGPSGLNTGTTKETNQAFRNNFVDNIINSDYTLCVRGIGNNSIRFFETLCCGRIPIFVNTNSVLPFDHEIDWKKYCVWVEEKDINNIANIVADFHKRISNEDFLQMQKNARDLWVEYLSPLGFIKNVYRYV